MSIVCPIDRTTGTHGLLLPTESTVLVRLIFLRGEGASDRLLHSRRLLKAIKRPGVVRIISKLGLSFQRLGIISQRKSHSHRINLVLVELLMLAQGGRH
jgi:hypothetical protein